MHLSSDVQIPDGLLAANALLAENSRQGFETYSGTVQQGFEVAISSTSLGISNPLYDGRVRSRCTGKERDSESGLDYFGARYYNSNMSRWLSPDWSAKAEPVPYSKMDNPQTLNLYGYVGNNPLSKIDADGHIYSKKGESVPGVDSSCTIPGAGNRCPQDPVVTSEVVIAGADALQTYQAQNSEPADQQQTAAPGREGATGDKVKKGVGIANKVWGWYKKITGIRDEVNEIQFWQQHVDQMQRNMDRDTMAGDASQYRIDTALKQVFFFEVYVASLKAGVDQAGDHLLPGEKEFFLPMAELQRDAAMKNYVQVRNDETGH